MTTDRDALPDGRVVATGIERAAAAIMSEPGSETAGADDTAHTEERVDAPS